jgi:hypothetical protein
MFRFLLGCRVVFVFRVIRAGILLRYYTGVLNRIGRSVNRARVRFRSISRWVDRTCLMFGFHLECRIISSFMVLRACTLLKYYSGLLNRIDRSIGQSVDRSIGRARAFKV